MLDPSLMLPPPHIKGQLKSIYAADGKVTQIFFSKKVSRLRPDYPNANYMYFHGGILTFGKLTMNDADMQIADNDPKDHFDFFNDHYFEQLTSGYHKTTADDGLVIYMPDYNDMKK
jgi:hypothetical protein